MITASLLWYLKFKKDLENIGFKFNDYDPCIANRLVNGYQHTVRFMLMTYYQVMLTQK